MMTRWKRSIHVFEYTCLLEFLGPDFTKQSWRDNMAAAKKRGGNPGLTLQPQMAKMLKEVRKKRH